MDLQVFVPHWGRYPSTLDLIMPFGDWLSLPFLTPTFSFHLILILLPTPAFPSPPPFSPPPFSLVILYFLSLLLILLSSYLTSIVFLLFLSFHQNLFSSKLHSVYLSYCFLLSSLLYMSTSYIFPILISRPISPFIPHLFLPIHNSIPNLSSFFTLVSPHKLLSLHRTSFSQGRERV